MQNRILLYDSLGIAVSLALVILASPQSTLADEMKSTTFSDYALSESLTPDETYTVELLIDRVRRNFDPDYWDHWGERSDAREASDYQPHFSKDLVLPAAKELKNLTWLSVQRLGDRPVRDLTAVQFLSKLTGLVLTNNEITDISALAGCLELQCLYLTNNPIRDISALVNCKNIEELHIGGIPAGDLSALQDLPKLRELSITTDQVPAFKRLECLPALQKLDLGIDTFDSFEGFPQMPELRVMRGAHVNSLQGLERYPKLQNLENLSGGFSSLEPLRNLKNLTHANILGCRVESLEPLGGLFAFRDLWISTEVTAIDLTPLKALPALHDVMVKCNGKEVPALDKLREELTSWDIEFRSATPRHTPSLDLRVVDREIFDIHDTDKPFNVTAANNNYALLRSELNWLDEQIEDLLSVDFEEEEDYVIPYQWGGARSRTVALFSDKAVEAFPRIVLGIQNILSHSKEDWIIYLQADGVKAEFIVWVYPDKIMLTKENEKTVRRLIKMK